VKFLRHRRSYRSLLYIGNRPGVTYVPARNYLEGSLQLRTPTIADRQKAAAEARQQAEERYRARINEPEFAERQAARQAIAAARQIRIAERTAAEEARRAQEAAEQAAREEAERAARKAALEAERVAREAALQAEIAGRRAAAEAKAARQRELETALLDNRKARKAARKAKKRRPRFSPPSTASPTSCGAWTGVLFQRPEYVARMAQRSRTRLA
jgi:phage-related minor tail protein